MKTVIQVSQPQRKANNGKASAPETPAANQGGSMMARKMAEAMSQPKAAKMSPPTI